MDSSHESNDPPSPSPAPAEAAATPEPAPRDSDRVLGEGNGNGEGSHESPPKPPSERPKRLMRAYDLVLTLVFVIVWLGPIAWVGATKKETPGYPAWLRHQHRISCLFINDVKGWQTYRLEVQRGGSGRWEAMSEDGYFELPVFGYRSRLHRVLGHSYKRGKGAQRLRDVGRYIKARYDHLNPSGPSLDALRFVRIYMTNEMLAKQSGRFEPMQPEEVPDNYVVYFGELRFDGKRATHAGWGSTRKAKRPPRAAAPTPHAPASATAPASAAATASQNAAGVNPPAVPSSALTATGPSATPPTGGER